MDLKKILPWITPGLLLVFIVLQFVKPSGSYKVDPETKKALRKIDGRLDSLASRENYKQEIIIIQNETKQKLNSLDTLRDSVAVSQFYAELDSALIHYKRHLENN